MAEQAPSKPDTSERGRPADTGESLLHMAGIRKTFGSVVALDDVDFSVAGAEIHGLLGGNGAGKTTLMNVLYGLYRPDAGTVSIEGREIMVRAPRDAINHGIGMVHQNFLQVDSYTVTENVVLGTDQPSFPTLRLGSAARHVGELAERFGLGVEPHARVQELSVGIRQRVEILKALYRGAKLLVLDEPTTNLTPQEVDSLFGSLQAIVEEGMSVVFITHKIHETLAVCDRMSVMRDGRRVAAMRRGDMDGDQLAALMVGDDPDEVGDEPDLEIVVGQTSADEQREASNVEADVRVEATGLRVTNDQHVVAVHGIDLSVRRGEVLGVAGVAGNGQVELVEALAGVRPVDAGAFLLDGRDLVGLPTAGWLQAGVAYVPEDRSRDGILPTLSVAENLVLGSQRDPALQRSGLIDWPKVRRTAVAATTAYGIQTAGVRSAAGALSGGNMQRVILARAFAHEPSFLLLHNPTRGLDIRSTQFVYEQIRRATAAGSCVLLVTEDLDELIRLSDRVLVIYTGRIVGEKSRGEYDPYEIGRLMTGMQGSP